MTADLMDIVLDNEEYINALLLISSAAPNQHIYDQVCEWLNQRYIHMDI